MVVDVLQTVSRSVKIIAPIPRHLEFLYTSENALERQIKMPRSLMYHNHVGMYCFHGRKHSDCNLSASELQKEIQLEINSAIDGYGLPPLICHVDYSVQYPRHYLLRAAWRSDLMAELNRRKNLEKSSEKSNV